MNTLTVNNSEPDFLTTGEFGRRVGLSDATVKRLCDSGKLAHVIVSSRGDRRIPRSELARFLREAEENRKGE